MRQGRAIVVIANVLCDVRTSGPLAFLMVNIGVNGSEVADGTLSKKLAFPSRFRVCRGDV